MQANLIPAPSEQVWSDVYLIPGVASHPLSWEFIPYISLAVTAVGRLFCLLRPPFEHLIPYYQCLRGLDSPGG